MGSFPINSCPKYGVMIEWTLRRYGKRELDGEISHNEVSGGRVKGSNGHWNLWEEGDRWGVFP